MKLLQIPRFVLVWMLSGMYLARLAYQSFRYFRISTHLPYTLYLYVLRLLAWCQKLILAQIFRFPHLPSSLLRLLAHDRIFKIGVAIKGDLTRLKKQFPLQLENVSFNTIDLKDYAVQRGVIKRKAKGSLVALVEFVLQAYLPKDENTRISNKWELHSIPPKLLQYAATDIYASHEVFEGLSKLVMVSGVKITTLGGTPVAVLSQEGGASVAYGKISSLQPKTYNGIRVAVPTASRIIVEVHTILSSSSFAPLHKLPNTPSSSSKTPKYFTLGEL